MRDKLPPERLREILAYNARHRQGRLRAEAIKRLLEGWDALPKVTRTAIERLMPRLAEMLEALREEA